MNPDSDFFSMMDKILGMHDIRLFADILHLIWLIINRYQCFPYIGCARAARPGKLRPAQEDKIQIPLFPIDNEILLRTQTIRLGHTLDQQS